MVETQFDAGAQGLERRRHPRYDVRKRMNLAIEDETIGESIGIGEARDISAGGLRVRHLPVNSKVYPGDRLALLLLGDENALSLHGEVVHYGAGDGFGVEFRDLSAVDDRRIDDLIQRLSQ